jgi:hypothetical protein
VALGATTNTIEHFTELYFTGGAASSQPNRSNGNNDIPAPVMGVSLSGQPETELVVVPDLDSQVWGLFPGNLAPYRALLDANNNSQAYPLFDLQEYQGGPSGSLYTCGGGPPTSPYPLWNTPIVQSAAFANPAAFVPPGTCATVQDPVLLLATGGVDWGPPASVIVALDLSPMNNNILGCTSLTTPQPSPCPGFGGDSAASPLPIQGQAPADCNPLIVATCPTGVAPNTPACIGRVFGAPLVDGQDVVYTTSTGSLTGVGSGLSAQQGTGDVEALGSACTATAFAGGSAACGICASSQTATDIMLNVGNVAGGLAASAPNSSGKISIYGASTTGLFDLTGVTQNAAKQQLYQKIMLQDWWLRQQPRTPP